jgi:hypothetical protein
MRKPTGRARRRGNGGVPSRLRKTERLKSILAVKHDDTPRSRALGVLSNVFLHLHPAKINRDAVAYTSRGAWAE